jgi:FMN-dependent NADH-azoreductase
MSHTPAVLLRVDSSPRIDGATRSLTAAYADAWQAHHPHGEVRHHDLPALALPHLGATELGAWFADPDERVALHDLVLARSNHLIDDLLAADEIVIGTPMWNFTIPSNLKAWIDHVVRAGRTVEFGATGPVGAAHARATVVTARGSDFRPGGPAAAFDFQEPYLRHILGFVGILDVHFVHADHQGPNWADGADVVAAARTELMELAAARAGAVPVA